MNVYSFVGEWAGFDPDWLRTEIVRNLRDRPGGAGMNTSERRAVFLLLAAFIGSPALFAGEYGLIVDSSSPHPCKYAATRTLNECTPAAVVKDLRGHFISGKPFRLRAVEMAVRSGAISLSPDALPPFNDAIVAICVAEPRKDSLLLVRFLSFLPYSSLRRRLVSEIEVTPFSERPEVRSRLEEALRALPKAPLSATEKAILAYKYQLSDAGDGDKCNAAVERVGRAMTVDSRLSDASIQAEIDLYEKHKGPMPYPSPGTACALFGFQEAAHAALQQRGRK
jgi:hypothetical protein